MAFRGLSQLVLCLFQCYVAGMNEDHRPVSRYDLVFNVEMALSKARKLWPRKHVPGRDNPLRPIAEAVVRHLELCRIRFYQPPPARQHGTPAIRIEPDGNNGEAEP